ncbi:MAG: toll/interleukin-1 receptor domain-containing protein [Chloroflexi bacterium]|nr:toll/interleukin-1 receptor domain-containing protein [Chloroflexota bacterium]
MRVAFFPILHPFQMPSQREFRLHDSPPLDLAVFPSYLHRERKTVFPILDFMRDRRHFDVWLDIEEIKIGDNFVEILENSIKSIVNRGGYVVVFWSNNESKFVIHEALYGLREERVIVAALGGSMPEFMSKYHDMFIQLIDENGLNNNRLDDLIVRLYWLIVCK